MNDEYWMQRCLDLAEEGAGYVSPNPMVGAAFVDREGQMLGEGFHEFFGGPHAEVMAVRNAEEQGFGERMSEATLFLNLEPCSHHSKTPPCADLILEKRVPRVVVAMQDPNPQVAGDGIARLREAGVEVIVGVLEKEAKRLNEAFARHITSGMPLVTLKIAQTLDGKVGTSDGEPLMVSSLESRTLVHKWRSQLDAVLIGAGTALADNPQLTVRHGVGRQPLRVVLDRSGELPASLKLFSDEHASRTVVVTGEDANPVCEADLIAGGGRVIRVSESEGHLDLRAVLETLGKGEGSDRPIQSVLVEAGPRLATALLQLDLVDRLFVFTAPSVLGEGVPAFEHWLAEEPVAFADVEWEGVADDVLFKGYLRAL